MSATPQCRLRRHRRRRRGHERHSSVPAAPAPSSSARVMSATPQCRLRRHRRRRAGHVSIPSAAGASVRSGAGSRRPFGQHPLALGSGCRGRVAQHPDLADRRDSPRRIDGNRSGSGAPLPARHWSVSTSAGEICSNTEVSVWRRGHRRPPPHRDTTRRRVLRIAVGHRPAQRRDVAAMAVDEDQALRPAGGRPAVLQQQRGQRVGADGDCSGKLWCSPLAPYATAGATIQCSWGPSLSRAVTARATAWRSACRCRVAGGTVLLGRSDRYRQA